MPPTWLAPAKLNLFLHVIGRRADGYHRLQTVFQFLDFHDRLGFESTASPEVRLARPLPGIPEDRELCVRAARALQAATGTRQGAVIHVEKLIPPGGGLGGGSSDAATTLIALNQLWGLGLARTALMPIGLALGADVPVFLQGHAAFAEGVGEQLTEVVLSTPAYVVISPPAVVSTTHIFQQLRLTAFRRPMTIAGFREREPCGMPGSGFGNDLMSTTTALYPAVARALGWLSGQSRGDPIARMTGSGGCCFMAFECMGEAQRVASRCPQEIGQAWAVQGLNRHPHAGT